MNRILLTLFTFAFLSMALGQERTKPELHRPLQPSGPDTAGIIQENDSVPLFTQTPPVQSDTVYVEPDFSHSPSRALMVALVLPGLGQAYNQKYWKMPIVWLALGGAGYAISYNTRQYRLSSQEYANNPDDTNERYLQFWRRNMELSYIAALGVYALQVLDAYVDAQLYSWDVNDNLSMDVSPSLQPLMSPCGLTGQAYGLTCTFKLK
ncbi:MAG: DUF5683 domain-containing protein [Bacteroidota bacterium]